MYGVAYCSLSTPWDFLPARTELGRISGSKIQRDLERTWPTKTNMRIVQWRTGARGIATAY